MGLKVQTDVTSGMSQVTERKPAVRISYLNSQNSLRVTFNHLEKEDLDPTEYEYIQFLQDDEKRLQGFLFTKTEKAGTRKMAKTVRNSEKEGVEPYVQYFVNCSNFLETLGFSIEELKTLKSMKLNPRVKADKQLVIVTIPKLEDCEKKAPKEEEADAD